MKNTGSGLVNLILTFGILATIVYLSMKMRQSPESGIRKQAASQGVEIPAEVDLNNPNQAAKKLIEMKLPHLPQAKEASLPNE
jgi:hypothetical protein